jgi:hypothetical protein
MAPPNDNDDTARENSALRQIKRLEEQQKDLKEVAKDTLDIAEQSLASAEEKFGIQKESLEKKREEVDVERRLIAARQEHLELLVSSGKVSEESAAKANEDLETKDNWLKEHAKTLVIQEKSLGAQQKIAKASLSAFGSIATRMMITQSATAAGAKSMFSMWKSAVKLEGRAKGTAKAMKSIGSSFLQIFNPINLITSGMKAIFTATLEFMWKSSEAMANFSATTGDAGSMAKDLGKSMNYAAGIGITEISAAGAALAGNWTAMADVTDRARISTVKIAGELTAVGISGATFGKGMNFLTRSMGISLPKAASLFKGLASSAKLLGQTPQQLADNFMQMSDELALYGNRMMIKFNQIAGTAKAMGIEMSDVVSIGEGFETFEGAAQKVSAFNQAFGTSMSSLEMMKLQETGGPDAVVKEIVHSLRAAGIAYEDMSKLEIKHAAAAAGTTTAKFASMMGFRDEEAEAAAAAAAAEQKSQKNYQRMLRSTVSLAKRLMLSLEQIFMNPDLQKALKDFMRDVLSFFGGSDSAAGGSVKEWGEILTETVKAVHGLFNNMKPMMTFMLEHWKELLALWITAQGLSLFTTVVTAGGAAVAAAGGAAVAAPVIAGAVATGAVLGTVAMGGEMMQSMNNEGATKRATEKQRGNQIRPGEDVYEAAARLAEIRTIQDQATAAGKSIDFESADKVRRDKIIAAEDESWWGRFSKPGRMSNEAMAAKNARMAEEAAKLKVGPPQSLKFNMVKDIGKEISKGISGQKGERAAQAKEGGKMQAQAFVEELNKNAKPTEVEIKIKLDDALAGNPQVAKMLYDAVTGKFTAITGG